MGTSNEGYDQGTSEYVDSNRAETSFTDDVQVDPLAKNKPSRLGVG